VTTTKRARGNHPVNLYKRKARLPRTVLGNVCLGAEGAIGRVNHTPSPLQGNLHYVEGQSIAIIPTARPPTAAQQTAALFNRQAPRHWRDARRQDGFPLRSAQLQYEKIGDGTILTGLLPVPSATLSQAGK